MINILADFFPGRCLTLAAVWLLSLAAASAQTADPAPVTWVSTWGTGMSSAASDQFFAASAYKGNNVFNDQVIRQTVHASLGGAVVRLRLSNELGTAPLAVGAVHVALTDSGANIVPGTDRTVTFRGGSTTVTIPTGTPEISDAISLDVPANANLSISVYFPTATPVTTVHPRAMQATYVSPAGSGDVTAEAALPLDPVQPSIDQWSLLSGVEVKAAGARTFVALGSSITDGLLSTPDANRRWTDYLAARLARKGLPVGVVNASIIANPILRAGNGGPALARFDRDVLARPGAAYVFINDILGVEIQGTATNSDADYANAVIGGLRQYRTRAHSQGIKAYAGTIIPLGGASNYTPSYEARRQIINAFIRGGGLDGYADFDAAVRDPADPTRILAAYDGGDHHHLNDAGYKVLARSFDLTLFQ